MEKNVPSGTRGSLTHHVILGLLVLGVIGLACFVFWPRDARYQQRVLLLCTVDGESAPNAGLSGRLVMELGHRLQGMGFEVATSDHPLVTAALATAPADFEGAQAAVKARWRAMVTLRFTQTTTDVPGDYRELHGVGNVVLHADGDAPIGEHRLNVWGGSRQGPLTRARLVSEAIVHRASAVIAEGLVAHETLADPAGHDRHPALGPARAAVDRARDRAAASATRLVGRSSTRAALDHGPSEVTLHDPFDARRLIAGAGPRGALVWRIPTRRSGEDGQVDAERHQRLAWRKGDGKPETIWLGPKLHGRPTHSTDGKTVAFSEVVYTWARTLTVVDSKGTRRLATASVTTYTALALSPGGRSLAAYARDCADCARRLVVYDVSNGGLRLDLSDEGGAFAGFAWADDAQLLVLHTPPVEGSLADRRFPGQGQSLWRLSIDDPKALPKRLFTDEKGRRYGELSVGHGMAVLVPAAGEGRGLRVVAMADGKAHFIRTPHRAKSPRFAPDGRDLVFNLNFGGDTEVATVPVAGGETTMLTRNSVDDHRPIFSADGSRIFYEAVLRGEEMGALSSLASIQRPASGQAPQGSTVSP